MAFITPSAAAAPAENGYLEAETHPTDSAQTSKPEHTGLATIRESVTSDATGISTIAESDTYTRRSSTSSELTQISTTDISSHGDENDFENLNTNMNNAMEEVVAMPTVPLPRMGATPSGESGEGSSPKSLALSDVVVSLGTSTLMDTSHVAPTVPNGPREPEEALSPPTAPLSPPPDDHLGDGSPPPVPTSPPPFTTGTVKLHVYTVQLVLHSQRWYSESSNFEWLGQTWWQCFNQTMTTAHSTQMPSLESCVREVQQ